MTNEWTKEIETLRARNAALEAALSRFTRTWDCETCDLVNDDARGHGYDGPNCAAHSVQAAYDGAFDALSGGTQSLDAVVSAAVEARVAAIRARVKALARMEAVGRYDMQTCSDENDEHGYWHAADVLSAIGATEGGAP